MVLKLRLPEADFSAGVIGEPMIFVKESKKSQ
jgi:hypothetical protein